MATLANPSNFNNENIYKVIRAYYFSFSSARLEKKTIRWSEDEVINNSLKLLTPMVKSLSAENLLLLIKNISLLNIKNADLWKEIEVAFLNNAYKLMRTEEIPGVAASFSGAYRENPEIWQTIENVILKEVYPSQQFNARGSSDLLKAFTYINQGSEDLYNALVQNFTDCVNDTSMKDITKVLLVHARLKRIDKSLLDLILDRALVIKEEIYFGNISTIMGTSISLGIDSTHLDALEEEALKHLPSLQLYHISNLSFNYGKYLESEIAAPGKRKEFLKKIEKTYCKHYKQLLEKDRSESTAKLTSQIKLFWGLSKGDIMNEIEAWKSFSNELNNAKVDGLHASMAELAESLKEYLKKKLA